MIGLISREEMVKKYVTNEHEKNYIYNLSDEVYEQVADVIDYLEGDRDEVTFKDVLGQAMITCVHKFDFKTNNIIEFRFPKVKYEMMHHGKSNCEFSIEMDNEGYVKFDIKMTPEQHMIMTLLGTLEEFEEYFYTESIADKFTLIIK